MRNVSTAFSRTLANDKRDYLITASLTLLNGTHLTLTNANIWEGSFSIEDAVSAENVFQIGGAIIGQAKFTINNIDGTYDAYEFDNAEVNIKISLELEDGTFEPPIGMGLYTVDEALYNGSLISLTCLDNMSKFDKPFTEAPWGLISLQRLVQWACSRCGVVGTASTSTFPRNGYLAPYPSSAEGLTYRQVLSWAAQIAGCFARCNANGDLEIKSYDFSALDDIVNGGLDGGVFDASTPYASGDTADGGLFNPWNTGYAYDAGTLVEAARGVHIIPSSYSHNVATDDVVITGVRVVEKIDTNHISDYASAFDNTQTYSVGDLVTYNNSLYKCVDATTAGDDFDPEQWTQISIIEYLYGTTGYVVSVEDNDLIHGLTNGIPNRERVAQWLGADLIGVQFRKAEITHPSNPSIEAGDVALYFDRKGNQYSLIVSSTTFTAGGSQRTCSSAETPRKNSSQQYSNATRNYVDLRKQMVVDKDYLTRRLENASGLYTTTVQEQGGTQKIYYHNKQLLNESDIQMVFTTAGFSLTDNGGQTWYGMTVDGQFIADLLSVNGINANWINSGALTIKDANNNVTFYADTASGTVNIKASSFTLNGQSISTIAQNEAQAKVNILDNSLNQQGVYNRLTNNSSQQGVYLGNNGKLYLNFEYAVGQTLKLGGPNNANGILQVYDGVSQTPVAVMNKDGAFFSNPTYDGYIKIYESQIYFMWDADATQYDYIFGSIGVDDISDDSGWRTSNDEAFVIDQSRESHSLILRGLGTVNGDRVGIEIRAYTIDLNGNIYVNGTLLVAHSKGRLVKDTSYGDRVMYCYETPTPYFGDIGTGKTDENGEAFISIDDIFDEAVNTNVEYCVFLQKEGPGDLWVDEKSHSFFIVKGTPNLKFSWEVKAVQKGFEELRLDDCELTYNSEVPIDDIDQLLDNELTEFDKEMEGLFQ